jgi:hypothetical protein
MKRSKRQPYSRSVRKSRLRNRHKGLRTFVPHTKKQFFVMPKAFQDRWNGVTHVISKMRADHVSLREASREFGLDPRTVARLGKSALRKHKNGKYAAKGRDKLLRILAVPSRDGGMREVATRDSQQSTLLGKYWAAVQKYLQTGDSSALEKFRGKHITDASGERVPLLTDLAELDRRGSAGVLVFETLYAKAG